MAVSDNIGTNASSLATDKRIKKEPTRRKVSSEEKNYDWGIDG